MLDPRLIELHIEMDGKINIYRDLFISANGKKTVGTKQNECTIKIANLSKENRHFLITETSPFQSPRKRKTITLFVGRKSIGLSKVFMGDIVSTTVSQPPDIMLTIKARTSAFFMSEFISVSYSENKLISQITHDISESMELSCCFEADDKYISNYNYSGIKLGQLNKLADLSLSNVFIDDDKLIVKNRDTPLKYEQLILNSSTGLIGIPELTEDGIKVKYLFDHKSKVGSKINIESNINPAANGQYAIYSLGFDVSNYNNNFYTTAECRRLDLWKE